MAGKGTWKRNCKLGRMGSLFG